MLTATTKGAAHARTYAAGCMIKQDADMPWARIETGKGTGFRVVVQHKPYQPCHAGSDLIPCVYRAAGKGAGCL